jgi:hypothetical protein
MNTETKYILFAIGGVAAVILVIFLVNQARKMQAARKMQQQEQEAIRQAIQAQNYASAVAAAAEAEIGFIPAFSVNYGN